MKNCKEIGRWVEENIEKPVERFFEDALEVCSEVRRWVEREIRRPIEIWRQQQEQRCKEQGARMLLALSLLQQINLLPGHDSGQNYRMGHRNCRRMAGRARLSHRRDHYPVHCNDHYSGD